MYGNTRTSDFSFRTALSNGYEPFSDSDEDEATPYHYKKSTLKGQDHILRIYAE